MIVRNDHRFIGRLVEVKLARWLHSLRLCWSSHHLIMNPLNGQALLPVLPISVTATVELNISAEGLHGS
jgi:hypothetical protein